MAHEFGHVLGYITHPQDFFSFDKSSPAHQALLEQFCRNEDGTRGSVLIYYQTCQYVYAKESTVERLLLPNLRLPLLKSVPNPETATLSQDVIYKFLKTADPSVAEAYRNATLLPTLHNGAQNIRRSIGVAESAAHFISALAKELIVATITIAALKMPISNEKKKKIFLLAKIFAILAKCALLLPMNGALPHPMIALALQNKAFGQTAAQLVPDNLYGLVYQAAVKHPFTWQNVVSTVLAQQGGKWLADAVAAGISLASENPKAWREEYFDKLSGFKDPKLPWAKDDAFARQVAKWVNRVTLRGYANPPERATPSPDLEMQPPNTNSRRRRGGR